MADWLSISRRLSSATTFLSEQILLESNEEQTTVTKCSQWGSKEIKSESIGAFYWRSSFGQTTLQQLRG